MPQQQRSVTGPLAVATAGPACCAPLTSQPIPAGQVADLAGAFKAIGDPVRLQLLSMIASHAGGEVCVCDLTPAFSLSGPTISHHLKVLREAGLIDHQRRGTWVYYWVVPSRLADLARLLDIGAAAPAGR
jgi:ArsR family transcriptional regulator, arsenate/arsenite/antimonite-responsive transcriptional repressor